MSTRLSTFCMWTWLQVDLAAVQQGQTQVALLAFGLFDPACAAAMLRPAESENTFTAHFPSWALPTAFMNAASHTRPPRLCLSLRQAQPQGALPAGDCCGKACGEHLASSGAAGGPLVC